MTYVGIVVVVVDAVIAVLANGCVCRSFERKGESSNEHFTTVGHKCPLLYLIHYLIRYIFIFILFDMISNQMRYLCNLVNSTQYALVRFGPGALNFYSTLRIFGLQQHSERHFVLACPVCSVISWYFIVGNSVSLRKIALGCPFLLC